MAHILIVDACEAIADLYARILESQGHTSDVACDGQGALDLIFCAEMEYDLVITGLRLPGRSGKDLLECSRPVLKDRTPVIVATAWPHPREALGVAWRWAFRILDKPVEVAGLRDAIDRGLEQRALYMRLREHEVRIERLRKDRQVLLERCLDLHEEVRSHPLTGLPNRKRLDEELDIHLANATRRRTRFAVAYCDLDEFDRVDSQLGYGASDAVLRAVAERLTGAARRGDTVYGYGGDRFVIVFAHRDLHEACHAADRFRRALADEEVELGTGMGTVRLALSGGVAAVTPEILRTPSEILGEAIRLCLQAQAAGGNRIYPCTAPEDD